MGRSARSEFNKLGIQSRQVAGATDPKKMPIEQKRARKRKRKRKRKG